MTICTFTSKAGLIVISLIFWAAAAGLFFIGGWVYNTYDHYNELTTANLTLIPATIILAVGVFMFILGVCGCVAACKESKILLAVLFTVLLIILCAEVTAAGLAYGFREDVKKAVKEGLDNALQNYNTSTQKDQMNYVQRQMHCCGVNNATDWGSSKGWNNASYVPDSCCIIAGNCTASDLKPNSTNIFQKGCFTELNDMFASNLGYIAGVSITFALIQLLGMICSCILFCRSKEVRYEVLGGPNSGLRV